MRTSVANLATPLRLGFRRCVERQVPMAVGIYGVIAATVLELCEALRIPEILGPDGFGLLTVAGLCGLPVVAVLRFLRSS